MEIADTNCVICGDLIGVDENGWAGGNNAEPVREGKCCTTCDNEVVIPARWAAVEIDAGIRRLLGNRGSNDVIV